MVCIDARHEQQVCLMGNTRLHCSLECFLQCFVTRGNVYYFRSVRPFSSEMTQWQANCFIHPSIFNRGSPPPVMNSAMVYRTAVCTICLLVVMGGKARMTILPSGNLLHWKALTRHPTHSGRQQIARVLGTGTSEGGFTFFGGGGCFTLFAYWSVAH